MESLPANPDVSAVNPDVLAVSPDELYKSELNEDTVTVPKKYLEYLEGLIKCEEEPRYCEEIFAITVGNNVRLRKLLVRQDAKNIDDQDVNTQFYNIFYSDVTIEHRSEYTEKTKKKLIKWYLDGCGHLEITYGMSAIHIQNCEIISTSSEDNDVDTYYPGCYSDYFIDVSNIGLRKCYDLCIDLKKLNRLSESDKVIHIMSTY